MNCAPYPVILGRSNRATLTWEEEGVGVGNGSKRDLFDDKGCIILKWI
jgi:hypothetical protein